MLSEINPKEATLVGLGLLFWNGLIVGGLYTLVKFLVGAWNGL